MNNEVVVLFGAGAIGEAIVSYCWPTIVKIN